MSQGKQKTAMELEIEALRAENAKLKTEVNKPLVFKVSEKGALSIYNTGSRFPTTLYKEQWTKLLDASSDIRAFIKANNAQLKGKE